MTIEVDSMVLKFLFLKSTLVPVDQVKLEPVNKFNLCKAGIILHFF